MKKLIVLLISVFAGKIYANQSATDIQTILADSTFLTRVNEAEIKSITNNGQRRYTFVYGRCSAQIGVSTKCFLVVGGACIDEVLFDTSAVNCLTEMP